MNTTRLINALITAIAIALFILFLTIAVKANPYQPLSPMSFELLNLNNAIAEAQSRNQADYTSESWMRMQMALNTALGVLHNPLADQFMINLAAASLLDRISELELMNPPPEEPPIHYAIHETLSQLYNALQKHAEAISITQLWSIAIASFNTAVLLFIIFAVIWSRTT